MVNSYINVKNALVKGESKSASEAIAKIQQEVKNDLLNAVDKMVQATNLDKQRTALNNVSTILLKVVKSLDKVSQPVYYQYCPMKKAYWLSQEKVIKNPFYGSSMLTCGKTDKTYE